MKLNPMKLKAYVIHPVMT